MKFTAVFLIAMCVIAVVCADSSEESQEYLTPEEALQQEIVSCLIFYLIE